MRLALVLVISSLALAGCVKTKYTLVNPSAQRYEAVQPEQVWIVTAESELDTLNYVRIAIIEATGSGEVTDQTGMLKAMRKRAGELGANAVLLPQIHEPGAGAKVAGAVFGTGTQRKGTAIAIRVLGPKTSVPGGARSEAPAPIPVIRLTVD